MTAPETKSAGDGDARKAGRDALRQLGRLGDRASTGPTLERLVQAGGAFAVEMATEIVEVSKGDKFEGQAVQRPRMRMADSPLARLASRGQLGGQTPGLNLVRAAAGNRYCECWYTAGLAGRIGAMDPTRPFVGAGPPSGMLEADSAMDAWRKFRAATESLDAEHRRVVDAVCLDERSPEDVGREITGRSSRKVAVAVAMHVLRHGLTMLARHFGMM